MTEQVRSPCAAAPTLDTRLVRSATGDVSAHHAPLTAYVCLGRTSCQGTFVRGPRRRIAMAAAHHKVTPMAFPKPPTVARNASDRLQRPPRRRRFSPHCHPWLMVPACLVAVAALTHGVVDRLPARRSRRRSRSDPSPEFPHPPLSRRSPSQVASPLRKLRLHARQFQLGRIVPSAAVGFLVLRGPDL